MVLSWAWRDSNGQRECPGDVAPHAQAFNRGNASRVKPSAPCPRKCLAWSLRERTERGVYAASAWRDPCDVAELHERQESADDEAA